MTNWNTFDLNLLVVFDTVMQEKNLTRTGQRLGLTQSAVSHALARLRHMLKDELFVRTPEGMQPTPRAERMSGPIHQALQEMRVSLRLMSSILPRHREPSGLPPTTMLRAQSFRPSFTMWPHWRPRS